MAQTLNSSSLATTSILLLFLHHLFLFSSLTTATTTTTTTTTTTPVLDIEGNPLEVGSEYYIILGFIAGGLRLRSRDSPSIYKFVSRTTRETDPGCPVEFLPSNSTQKTIDVSDVIRIRFTGEKHCGSNVWELNGDPTNGQIYVSTQWGTRFYNIYQLFTIEKMGNLDGQYKIRYTHDEENYNPDMLGGDIGTLEENGFSWLGVSDEPLTLYFVKKHYNEVE